MTEIDDKTKENIESLKKQEAESKENRLDLILRLEQSGDITLQFGRLLRKIRSSTLMQEETSLLKVKAALQIKDYFSQLGLDQKTVAYLGSGLDWEFPVALGARVVDLVDLIYVDDSSISELLERVRESAPSANFDQRNSKIEFQLDLGNGIENIVLQIHGEDATDYTPKDNLAGVVEILGPSVLYGDGTMPLLSNVAKSLGENGFIANFDFNKEDLRQNSGLGIRSFDGFEIYEVTDTNAFCLASEKAGNTLMEAPSLESIRNAIKKGSKM